MPGKTEFPEAFVERASLFLFRRRVAELQFTPSASVAPVAEDRRDAAEKTRPAGQRNPRHHI